MPIDLNDIGIKLNLNSVDTYNRFISDIDEGKIDDYFYNGTMMEHTNEYRLYDFYVSNDSIETVQFSYENINDNLFLFPGRLTINEDIVDVVVRLVDMSKTTISDVAKQIIIQSIIHNVHPKYCPKIHKVFFVDSQPIIIMDSLKHTVYNYIDKKQTNWNIQYYVAYLLKELNVMFNTLYDTLGFNASYFDFNTIMYNTNPFSVKLIDFANSYLNYEGIELRTNNYNDSPNGKYFIDMIFRLINNFSKLPLSNAIKKRLGIFITPVQMQINDDLTYYDVVIDDALDGDNIKINSYCVNNIRQASRRECDFIISTISIPPVKKWASHEIYLEKMKYNTNTEKLKELLALINDKLEENDLRNNDAIQIIYNIGKHHIVTELMEYINGYKKISDNELVKNNIRGLLSASQIRKYLIIKIININKYSTIVTTPDSGAGAASASFISSALSSVYGYITSPVTNDVSNLQTSVVYNLTDYIKKLKNNVSRSLLLQINLVSGEVSILEINNENKTIDNKKEILLLIEGSLSHDIIAMHGGNIYKKQYLKYKNRYELLKTKSN